MYVFIDFRGREITLSDEGATHILNGHPELEEVGFETALRRTLAEPDVVVQSLSDERGSLYYQLRAVSPYEGKYVCVVVKSLEYEAFIWTAYVSSRITTGEAIWRNEA